MRPQIALGLPLAALLACLAAPSGVRASGSPRPDGHIDLVPPSDSVPDLDPDSPYRLFQDELFTLDIGVRLQVRYSHAFPEEGDARGSFRVRRARLNLAGEAYRHFDYRVQFELAGSSARLLDATIGHTFNPAATLEVGQAKAPFGRQQLISSTRLQFVDRSIVDGRFSAGRQVGALLTGFLAEDRFEYGVGVYNGEGINVTNEDGDFMQVARLAWTPFGSYARAESSLDYPDEPRLALGVAGLNTTRAGEDPADEIGVRRLNLEAAFKVQGFNAMGEIYLERLDPDGADTSDTTGWYSQVAYLLPDLDHELALRYGSIDPDGPASGTNERTELALGFNRYIEGHNAKLQADVVRIEDRTAELTDTELRVQLQVAF